MDKEQLITLYAIVSIAILVFYVIRTEREKQDKFFVAVVLSAFILCCQLTLHELDKRSWIFGAILIYYFFLKKEEASKEQNYEEKDDDPEKKSTEDSIINKDIRFTFFDKEQDDHDK